MLKKIYTYQVEIAYIRDSATYQHALFKRRVLVLQDDKQEAWWPNKLHGTIHLTKPSTYYVKSGVKKRPSVYYKCENQPGIDRHISDPRPDLVPMGPFGAPDVAFKGKWQSQCVYRAGPKGFHMAFETCTPARQFPKICCGEIWSHWAFYFDLKGPPTHF